MNSKRNWMENTFKSSYFSLNLFQNFLVHLSSLLGFFYLYFCSFYRNTKTAHTKNNVLSRHLKFSFKQNCNSLKKWFWFCQNFSFFFIIQNVRYNHFFLYKNLHCLYTKCIHKGLHKNVYFLHCKKFVAK